MRSNHTPAPWEVEHFTRIEDEADVLYIKRACITVAVQPKGYRHEAEDLANANLIAAAPDMLAALKRLKALFAKHRDSASLITDLCSQPDLGLEIYNAIAKAEGGEA